jgi:hypothetical protein
MSLNRHHHLLAELIYSVAFALSNLFPSMETNKGLLHLRIGELYLQRKEYARAGNALRTASAYLSKQPAPNSQFVELISAFHQLSATYSDDTADGDSDWFRFTAQQLVKDSTRFLEDQYKSPSFQPPIPKHSGARFSGHKPYGNTSKDTESS